MTRLRLAIIGGATVAVAVAVWLLQASGGSSPGLASPTKGDRTTEAAVVRALRGTGLTIRFRATPRVEGYDMVAGAARGVHGEVAFSVVIRLAGPFKKGGAESALGGSPQFPVVPYVEGRGTTYGNVVVQTQPQSAYRVRRVRHVGQAWVPSRVERAMSIRIGRAVAGLFAPGVRGQA